LAVKAADTIHARVVNLSGGKVTPKKIIAIDESAMREAGVSGDKFRPYRSVVAWYCWRALEK
jgi:DNA-3-methyladenine glycosylase II